VLEDIDNYRKEELEVMDIQKIVDNSKNIKILLA